VKPNGAKQGSTLLKVAAKPDAAYFSASEVGPQENLRGCVSFIIKD